MPGIGSVTDMRTQKSSSLRNSQLPVAQGRRAYAQQSSEVHNTKYDGTDGERTVHGLRCRRGKSKGLAAHPENLGPNPPRKHECYDFEKGCGRVIRVRATRTVSGVRRSGRPRTENEG
jgi:hypothetical protein